MSKKVAFNTNHWLTSKIEPKEKAKITANK